MPAPRALALLKLAVPVALVMQLIAWLRWGIDIPFMDDWRTLYSKPGTLELVDLFSPANDTLYPVGKFIDALMVRYFSYNSIVYQTLSMITCLGGIVALQYAILRKTASSLVLIPAFLMCVFIMQPYSYWGSQNIAFHQAIPLLTLLGAINVTLSGKPSSAARIASVSLLAMVGGFAYISGAFAALAALFVSLLFFLSVDKTASRPFRDAAIGFGVAAAVTLPAQLSVILYFQSGHIHTQTAWALPWSWEFWTFALGLIARAMSLAVHGDPVVFSAIAAVCFVLAIAAITVHLTQKVILKTLPREDLPRTYALLVTVAVIACYVCLVSAGRSGLGAMPELGWSNYFSRGGGRFHFFWVTLLFPIAAAAILAHAFPRVAKSPLSISLLCVAILAHAFTSGAFSYDAAFKEATDGWQRPGLLCLQQRVVNNEPVVCPSLYPGDITMAVNNAKAWNTSFARLLDFPADVVGTPVPFTIENVAGGALMGKTADGLTLRGALDPQVYLKLEPAVIESGCPTLHLYGVVLSETIDIAELFYIPRGETSYKSENRASAVIPSDKLEISVSNVAGFEPMLRLDPGASEQTYRLSDLIVTCTN